MPLNEVQVKFVNEAARPLIEELVRIKMTILDPFVVDFDNQQDPLPTDATILDDGNGGEAPRTDAPKLTGANVTALRNFANNMANQISDVDLAAMVELAVRPVAQIIRNN